ncbi:MAG: hypothetical protein IPO05_03075, partial [Flavobacteriales bacterium]|nr:hypothetical protein [Flavobacteriales bacterium]
MSSDIAIHLFILTLSCAGVFFALLSLRSTFTLSGRIAGRVRTDVPIRATLRTAQGGRSRIRLSSSGRFRVALSTHCRATIVITQHRQILRTISIQPFATHRSGNCQSRTVLDLGDILLNAQEVQQGQCQLFYRSGCTVAITSGTARVRQVPFDRQLLDHSDHWFRESGSGRRSA